MKRFTHLFVALSLMVAVVMAALPSTPVMAGGGGDCYTYNPASLHIVMQGTVYVLTDGIQTMQLLDNATDAAHALDIARHYTQECFVGRSNTDPNHYAYISQYWAVPSSYAVTPFTEDCNAFNATLLGVVQNGNYWITMAGNIGLAAFTTQVDAQWMATVIKGQGWVQQCFIGRSNSRPSRFQYIMEYWKTPIKWSWGS